MEERPKIEDRDNRVLELYEKVLEVEQRLIPTGLHVFGCPSDDHEIIDLLRMVASFDRPELGIRSLTNLIAEGLQLPTYQTLLKESAASEQRMTARERVEAIVRQAIAIFVSAQNNEGLQSASTFLAERLLQFFQHGLFSFP